MFARGLEERYNSGQKLRWDVCVERMTAEEVDYMGMGEMIGDSNLQFTPIVR